VVIKILVVLMLLAVIASLFSGLFFMLRHGGGGKRIVQVLTLRVALSVGLFILIMIGFQANLWGSH
jgi:hypothetical protein